MKVLFIAGFGPIVSDVQASKRFYTDALGIPFEGDDSYLHTDELEGSKAFALWPLAGAAESCFGSPEWPVDIPVPHAWLEFDVQDMADAVRQLQVSGYRLLLEDKEEPWGQRVTRLLSLDGLLVGLTVTPWMRSLT